MTERECTICHKKFVPKHFNQTRCDGPHFKYCPVCGKEMPWTEYDRCCSKECTAIKRKSTCVDKYGTEYAQQSEDVKSKARETNLKARGVEYPSQSADVREKQLKSFREHYGKQTNPDGFAELDAKRRATCLERYGAEYSFQSDNNKTKSKATCLERYGTEYAIQNPEIQKRMRSTIYAKYGVQNVMQSSEIRATFRESLGSKYGVCTPLKIPGVLNKISDTNIERYGVPWYCMTDDCKAASGKIVSKLNQKFSELLKSKDIDFDMEFRLASYSYDFKIGNLLLEIDPSFTHNSVFNPFDKSAPGLPQDYHLNKTKVANSNGYRCIHIFDWDDWDKVINIFSSNDSERLYARNCTVAEVAQSDADAFLELNHLQGTCKNQSVRLGLYNDNNLVELMTFGKPRYNARYEWELLRLCTDSNTSVIGGASKLLSHFISTTNPDNIISYCDRSKFEGDVYRSLGFSLVNVTDPAKVWCKDRHKITDNLLRQRGFDQLFNAHHGKGTSNEQLMLDNNWWPVYDCGQYVFEWRKQ